MFRGLLQFLCSMFGDLLRLKLLRVYLQFLWIHYLIIAICLMKGYHVVGVVLPWVSDVSLLLSSGSSNTFVNVSSITFVPVIFITVILSVLYIIFLLGSLTSTCFGLLTDIQFSLNHWPFLENSCMDLRSPV